MRQLLLLATLLGCHIAPKKGWADSFKMVVIGDSFVAATFSNSDGFKRQKDMPEIGIKAAPRDISWVQKMLFKMTAWPEYSFGCGDKINSHYKKMKKYIDDIECRNLAVPGDRAEDLSAFQCPKAADMRPDYLLVEVGLNNIFQADTPAQMTSAREYEFHIRKCIDQVLLSSSPYIVLAPLPDLTDLPELIGDKRTVWWVTSKTVWEWAGFAPIVTDGKFKKEVQTRVAEYNAVLGRLKREYGERVYFNAKCANMKVKPEHVSKIDALHSSKKGHEFMSDCSFPF